MKKLIFFLFMILTAPFTEAALLLPLNLQYASQSSDVIVIGTITDISSEKPDRHVFTRYQIQVSEYIKGNGPSEISFIQPGGKSGKWVTKVSGVKQFPKGQIYCFFLHYDPQKNLNILGLSQGALKIKRDASGSYVLEELLPPPASTVKQNKSSGTVNYSLNRIQPDTAYHLEQYYKNKSVHSLKKLIDIYRR
jgi:hypothetical protein